MCWRLSKKRGFEVSSFYETLEALHWLAIDILRIKEERVYIVSWPESFNINSVFICDALDDGDSD